VGWDVVLIALGVVALGLLQAFVRHHFARKNRRQGPTDARPSARQMIIVLVLGVALLALSLIQIDHGVVVPHKSRESVRNAHHNYMIDGIDGGR
jgi:hypothetical protein